MSSEEESRVEKSPFKFIIARIKDLEGTERNILYKGRWGDPEPVIEHIRHNFVEHSNVGLLFVKAVTDQEGRVEEMRMVLTDWPTWVEAIQLGAVFPVWSES